MEKYNSGFKQDNDSHASAGKYKGHIDNITMSLYLGGGAQLREDLVLWIQSHLKRCEQCAKVLENKLDEVI